MENEILEPNKPETESKKTEPNNPLKNILDFVTGIIPGIKPTVDTYFENQLKTAKTEIRNYTFVVSLFVVVLFGLAYFRLIDSAAISTLFGSIIGYAFGRFSNGNTNNK